MPYNARQGEPITFAAVFFDTAGVVTVPSSATLTIIYPPSSNSLTTVSCSIGMTTAGRQEFTATWASSVGAIGFSSFTATSPGQASAAPGSAGTLRLIS
jgi:hypothetical protein